MAEITRRTWLRWLLATPLARWLPAPAEPSTRVLLDVLEVNALAVRLLLPRVRESVVREVPLLAYFRRHSTGPRQLELPFHG
jgi:hypothetical protein